MNGRSQHRSPEARRRGVARARAFTVAVALALLALLTVAVAAQAYSPGQRIWVKKYGTAAHQVDFNAVASGPGGVACAVGQQRRSGDDAMRGVVVRYNAAGKKLWARNYPAGTSTDFCELTHVAFDALGNIYALGQRQVKGSPNNMVLVKYSAKGALRWSRQYDGPAHLGDYPGGLAVDAKGFVYMSGSSQVSSSTWAVAVLKYDGAGRMKWKRPARIEPAGATCNNRDLAVDGARNVYVVGQHTISPATSLYLVKLSGATGSPGRVGDVAACRGGRCRLRDVARGARLDGRCGRLRLRRDGGDSRCPGRRLHPEPHGALRPAAVRRGRPKRRHGVRRGGRFQG